MRKKFKKGDLIFTVKSITDFYAVTTTGSSVYKMKPGTALIVSELTKIIHSKIGDKNFVVEMDLDCWVPVFYYGMVGWVYYDDIFVHSV